MSEPRAIWREGPHDIARWSRLPYPTLVTTNSMYKHWHQVELSDWAARYRDELLLALRGVPQPVPRGYLDVELWAYVPDRRRRDLDNLLKLAIDVTARELNFDDSRIVDLRVHKRWSNFDAHIDLWIRPAMLSAGEEWP